MNRDKGRPFKWIVKDDFYDLRYKLASYQKMANIEPVPALYGRVVLFSVRNACDTERYFRKKAGFKA